MQVQTLPLATTGQFSSLFLDYIQQSPSLTGFYGNYPDLAGFEAQLKEKRFSLEKRQILVDTLRKQYAHIEDAPDFSVLLDDNTFTVTTGHQLNIFTGPLYIIYKLITTINLAKALQEAYPAYKFVPVYWMATEDHDFAEINHFSLFGQTHSWETSQKGAVGRMNPQELATLIAQLPDCPEVFKKAYLQEKTLADAVRCYMHEWFGAAGLLCIDADDAQLKALFKPVIKDDLLQHTAWKQVNTTTQQLEDLGYKTQISPREINFFYLQDGLRERLVLEDGFYKVLHTDIQFTQAEILSLVETNPEYFSPNVVLRPLYEEVILPNLAYIGGPSEVPYWLQLKGVFEAYQETFPLLLPRNFALIVNKASQKKIEKLGLTVEELFLDEIQLKKNFIEKNSQNQLSLAENVQAFGGIFEEILAKAIKIDKTLEGAVKGEQQKLFNSLEHLEKRLKKAEERNHETEVNQLLALKHKLFPNGTPQERVENVLNFWLNNPDFLSQMQGHFDALNYRFYVIFE